ncbi:hypothetical protein BD626DRAFT_505780 [Schizophyllum amplum]|uniref:Uncharacterized protein n=1 Tax=Schizophyllum amplum TaxID=97359 RepID=A0A550C5X1_9AGAR|nr:hypothetical protein BD626DRAFT_505780 [Auriculariopsis ampla]
MTGSAGDGFEPKSTLEYSGKAALQGAAIGTLMSGIQNALQHHSHGAMGIFTRTGSTIGFFTAMGFTFAATEAYVGNLRQRNDYWNGIAGGCAAGFLAGLRARSVPLMLAASAGLGATIGMYDFGTGITGQQTLSLEEKRRRFFKQPPPPIVEAAE